MSVEILKETGALLDGHFLLSSGLHSNKYAQMAKLLQYPDKAAEVLKPVADMVRDLNVDVVVGPAMGGIVVAYELGRQLGVRAIFTERENNVMTLRRGFEIKPGERVLITEDIFPLQNNCIGGQRATSTSETYKDSALQPVKAHIIPCICEKEPIRR